MGWEVGEHPGQAEKHGGGAFGRGRRWRRPLPPGVPYADFPVRLLAAGGPSLSPWLGHWLSGSLRKAWVMAACLRAAASPTAEQPCSQPEENDSISDAFPPGSS